MLERHRLIVRLVTATSILAAVAVIAAVGAVSSPRREAVIPWLPLRPPHEPLRPLAPPCRASHVAAELESNGATGSLVLALTVRNVGPASCSLRGRPTLAFEGKDVSLTRWQTKPVATLTAEPASVRARLRALHPGEVAIDLIWWSNWCGPDSLPASGPAPPPDDLLVTLPGSGDVLRLATPNAPRCDDPTAPSILLVPPFAFRESEPPPQTKLPLAARILGQTNGKLSAKPGPVIRTKPAASLSYQVELKNTSRRPFRFRSCPSYIERVQPKGSDQTYVLNCRPLGTLAAGATARFAMVIPLPADLPPAGAALTWELGPNTFHAPFADAKLIVDR